MTIRRKLFLAFLAAAALPLGVVAVLMRSNIARMRAQLDQRFVDDARVAFRALDDRLCTRTQRLEQAVQAFASQLGDDAFLTVAPQAEVRVMSSPDDPPRLFAPSWEDDAEAEAARKEAQAARKQAQAARKQAEAARKQAAGLRWQINRELMSQHPGSVLVPPPVQEQALRLRRDEQAVLGVTVLRDDSLAFCDATAPASARDVQVEMIDRVDAKLTPTLSRYIDSRGHYFVRAVVDQGHLVVLAQYDPRRLVSAEHIDGGGTALLVNGDGRPYEAELAAAARSRPALVPPLPARQLPANGELVSLPTPRRRWKVYTAVSAEYPRDHESDGTRLLAVVPEDALYGAVDRFRFMVVVAIAGSLAFALGAAFFLSGRFVGAVENLKRGVAALSRGEFAQLEKSSADELGGELVESMNRMARELAERTRKEEVETWRRLVRVLSHEINNTLGPVKSVAATVRDQVALRLQQLDAAGDVTEDVRTAARLIVDRVDSLSSFIAGYAELAKLPPPERAPAPWSAVAQSAVEILRGEAAARRLAVDERYDDGGARAWIDRDQLERVAINVVKNAVEAARARVIVRTARRGDRVELTVEDDGPGIAAEARAHLFVPYFTTKPDGSGIGLALARQIVLGHGGAITAEDRDGGGTRVRVVVPVGDAA